MQDTSPFRLGRGPPSMEASKHPKNSCHTNSGPGFADGLSTSANYDIHDFACQYPRTAASLDIATGHSDDTLPLTLELTEDNRVYHEISAGLGASAPCSLYNYYSELPVLQPEEAASFLGDADVRHSPSTQQDLILHSYASIDALVEKRMPDAKKTMWKPRGLTLSAYRRPENTVRLTQSDPSRRLEAEYDLHGAGASGVLGHGAFSTVRLAVRLSDSVQVAVKSIAKHEALRSRRLRRGNGHGTNKYYLEEWEILQSLQDNPYVITLLDVFETSEEIQLVTEYCPGGELFDAIQKKERRNRRGGSDSRSESQAAQITNQILHALKSIHGHNPPIVHRDLKPENILLAKPADGESVHVKLCDFGVARPLMPQADVSQADPAGENGTSSVCISSDGDASPLTPGSRSRSFSTVGTDYYAAPELTYGGSYDTAVDIYSLGVTLYILLCGFPPVFGSSSTSLSHEEDDSDSEAMDEVLFPASYWCDVSFGAKALLRRMLHPDPTIRVSAKDALRDPWIQTWGSSTPKLEIAVTRAPVDLCLVRNELYKSLGGVQRQSASVVRNGLLKSLRGLPPHSFVSESSQRRHSSALSELPPIQSRKRSRDFGNSVPRLQRMERRASTTALLALADLYRGVAAPSVIAAAAAAAATSEDIRGVISTPSSRKGNNELPEIAFAVVTAPVPALSF